MKKKVLHIALLSLVLASALLVSSCAKDDGTLDGSDTSDASDEAYDGVLSNFTSEDMEGNAVDRSIFDGKKLTMVNIWATFCSPCIREMPELAELNEEYAERGVQVVGIVVDLLDSKGEIDPELFADAEEIIDATGADYIHIVPSTSLIAAKLRYVYSVPETIFVDEHGNQVGGSYTGAKSKEQWAAIIDSLLLTLEESGAS